MTIFIYGLEDPDTNEIRYIGKTVNDAARLKLHVMKSIGWHPDNKDVAEWINGLVVLGKLPRLRILDEANESNWQEKESECIAEHIGKGHLLNKRGGGSGGKTSKLSSNEDTVNIGVSMLRSMAVRLREAATAKGKCVSSFVRELVAKEIA